MANTYSLIASATPSGVTSVTLSSIPQTYTDLIIRLTGRTDTAAWVDGFENRINSSATTYTATVLGTFNNGSAVNVYSSRTSTNTFPGGDLTAASNTSNTFNSTEFYIPNYTSAQKKLVSITTVAEANASFQGSIQTIAVLWSQTDALTSFRIIANGNFVSGTSIYIYGIKNS
jgi:hypothetical protein